MECSIRFFHLTGYHGVSERKGKRKGKEEEGKEGKGKRKGRGKREAGTKRNNKIER